MRAMHCSLAASKIKYSKKRRWIKTSWRININIMSINMTFFNQIFFLFKTLSCIYCSEECGTSKSSLNIFACIHTYIMRRYRISRVIKKLYWKKSRTIIHYFMLYNVQHVPRVCRPKICLLNYLCDFNSLKLWLHCQYINKLLSKKWKLSIWLNFEL